MCSGSEQRDPVIGAESLLWYLHCRSSNPLPVQSVPVMSLRADGSNKQTIKGFFFRALNANKVFYSYDGKSLSFTVISQVLFLVAIFIISSTFSVWAHYSIYLLSLRILVYYLHLFRSFIICSHCESVSQSTANEQSLTSSVCSYWWNNKWFHAKIEARQHYTFLFLFFF